MFGTVSNGLTLTKVLGGISKTLSIANQVIPLYREAKPMIHNAKTILSVLKDINKPTNTKAVNKKTTNTSNISSNKSNNSTPVIKNNPVFFL